MPKRSSFLTLAAIDLDRSEPTALHRQLYYRLSNAILTRRLVPGTRLPPTRALAAELGVARNTVVNAFEQLLAEGYIEGKVGSGTYVSHALPDDVLQTRAKSSPPTRAISSSAALSKRGAIIASAPAKQWQDSGRPRAFRPGIPALDEFPFETWRQLANKRWRTLARDSLSYGEPEGYRPLRQAIVAYLGQSRGVRCEPEQVIVVAGSQQALDLAARLLLDPGDVVWMEEPGYRGARGALLAAGAKLVPVPVDAEGLRVDIGIRKAKAARVAYVTPSHQYPLGVTMSLARRLKLLEWAARSNAWILEDDYDSEYRYSGRPLTALQGLDTANRVIYIGTFSKVLFPALRLGYLVVPPNLVDAFIAARAMADRQSPVLDQAVLADFIAEGYFARHLRHMRALYAERRAALVDAVNRELDGMLEITSEQAGLHVMARLPQSIDDREVARRAATHNVEAPALSDYALTHLAYGGLVLGYAAVNENEIREGVRRLELAIKNRSNKITKSAFAD
ncbi:MAG: PLP-dependent aminotransferase family protein [Chloroflexi bacterium]|nr:PLP-dependent aminotransferase family protein [Chloroflexota bacterium]